MKLASYLECMARIQAPASLTIELLARCNLRCKHCFVDHRKRSVLTSSLVTQLTDQFADAGGLFVTFTGGEIGLRRDLCNLIAHARERRLFVTLLSSGTLWRPSHWEKLARAGAQRVRVSLYAMDPATHDRVTGVRGSQAKTIASIHGLMSLGINVQIACIVTRLNAGAVPQVLEFARRHDIGVGLDTRLSGAENGCRDTVRWLVDDGEMAEIFASPIVRQQRLSPMPARRKGSDSPCNVGRTMVFVAATGSVRPCANWPESAGNISKSKLLKIFRESAVFRQVRGLRRDDAQACRQCALLESCHQCPALAVEEHGTVTRPSARVCRASRALTSTSPTGM